MEGGLVGSKVVALRLNSDGIKWENRENRVVKDKIPAAAGGKWVGLIQLFSSRSISVANLSRFVVVGL